jgi:hypothetical protein
MHSVFAFYSPLALHCSCYARARSFHPTGTRFGIWPPFEAFYIDAMLFNTRSALASIEVAANMIRRLSGDILRDTDSLLANLQNIAVQGAVGYILPQYVGPLPQSDGVPAHIFRAYYTDAGC